MVLPSSVIVHKWLSMGTGWKSASNPGLVFCGHLGAPYGSQGILPGELVALGNLEVK